jgi:hypothetical protein
MGESALKKEARINNFRKGPERLRELYSDPITKKAYLEKNIFSKESIERSKETRKAWSPEKKLEVLRNNSFCNGSASELAYQNRKWIYSDESFRKNMQCKARADLRRYWASLTKEEVSVIVRNSFLSDKGVRKSIESRKVRPNRLELDVKSYLDYHYPNEWLYNGDLSQGVRVGNRVPDFIKSDGTKEAVSVMGCPGFCHFFGDDLDEISYYFSNGWKCVVIWEWEVWNPFKLDEILGGLNG